MAHVNQEPMDGGGSETSFRAARRRREQGHCISNACANQHLNRWRALGAIPELFSPIPWQACLRLISLLD